MTIALAMGGKAFGRGQLLAAAPGPEGAAFLLHSVLLQDHSVLLQERYRNRIDEIERLFFMHQVFKFFGRCFTKSLMIVRICRARSDCREGRKVMARTEWENSRCSSNQEGSGSIASSAAVTNMRFRCAAYIQARSFHARSRGDLSHVPTTRKAARPKALMTRVLPRRPFH